MSAEQFYYLSFGFASGALGDHIIGHPAPVWIICTLYVLSIGALLVIEFRKARQSA